MFGDYPETMKTRVGSRLLAFTEDESEQVKGAIDFVGVINYMALYVKDNSSSLKQSLHDFNIDMAVELTCKLYDTVGKIKANDVAHGLLLFCLAVVGNTSFNNEVCYIFH